MTVCDSDICEEIKNTFLVWYSAFQNKYDLPSILIDFDILISRTKAGCLFSLIIDFSFKIPYHSFLDDYLSYKESKEYFVILFESLVFFLFQNKNVRFLFKKKNFELAFNGGHYRFMILKTK